MKTIDPTYLRGIADELLRALVDSSRGGILRDERSECYASINGRGRTTPVESTILSRERIKQIDIELRAIRVATDAAIRRAHEAGIGR